MKNILKPGYVSILVGLSTPTFALEAISDHEMSEVSGQAFIQVDASSYSQNQAYWQNQGYSQELSQELAGDYEFTRVNLGLDIETVTTADSLRVGEFERTAYEDGTVPATVPVTAVNDDTGEEYVVPNGGNSYLDENGNVAVQPADIIINDFALGRIENYNNPALAEVDPFYIQNPYIELAYKWVDGVRKVAGVRIGFEKARGWLSGDIMSLTGPLEGEIRGPASVIYDGACSDGANSDASWFNCLELQIAGSTELVSSIEPVDGARNTANYGYGAGTEADEDGAYPYADVPYLKRASWAGVPAGRNFETAPGEALEGLIPALTKSSECTVTGTAACFMLNTYQSIYVGDRNKAENDFFGEDSGAASGAFVSLQTEAVPWEDLSGLDDADRVVTQMGAYLNLARFKSGDQVAYPLELDLFDATNGVSRQATCVGQLKGC